MIRCQKVMQMNALEKARKTIDEIDSELARLYEERMEAVVEVAKWKKENDLPVFDAGREKIVIEKSKDRIQDPNQKDDYASWIQNLMDLSKKRQYELLNQDTVAYCGVKGAFACTAAETLFPHSECVGYRSFEEVFQAVCDHQAAYGVIPLENTRSGMVGEVLDALMEYPVYIVQAADLKIEQCLLGLPEAQLSDIRWVYSKDQALWQSKTFLDALQVETIPYPNTAMAAQYVAAQNDVSKAAIGARESAELYGLKVLAENIEQDASNTTRFLVISTHENPEGGPQSSMLFSLSSTVGSLAKAIIVIAAFGLNMDVIQSRPRKGHPFEYFFYLQVDGSIPEESLKACLQSLNQICSSLRWLGSYSIRKEEEK